MLLDLRDSQKYHTAFGGNVAARKAEYADMVNKYYDLATSFYEYGWGESFHFAHRLKNESLEQSLKRHEHFLALRLQIGPGSKVLDVGCGIGGPLREIALFSGASVTGTTLERRTRGSSHEPVANLPALTPANCWWLLLMAAASRCSFLGVLCRTFILCMAFMNR